MEGLLVWHNWVAQLICGERRTNVKWNDFRSWASYCQQLIPTVSLLTVLENLPSLLWIVFVEIFFADNVGKQLNIEQILPRSKSASVLTYLKYPNWLQKGEPLVQTSDLQKDLHSLQNDQRKASVDYWRFSGFRGCTGCTLRWRTPWRNWMGWVWTLSCDSHLRLMAVALFRWARNPKGQ